MNFDKLIQCCDYYYKNCGVGEEEGRFSERVQHCKKKMKQEDREDEEIVFDTDSDTSSNHRKQILIFHLSQKLIHGDLHSRIEAAKDLRKLARKSSPKSRSNLGASSLIQPLVCMLLSPNLDAREASLLALLNLASRNERFVFLFHFFLYRQSKFNVCPVMRVIDLID